MVLPAPLGPMIENTSPGCTSKLTPRQGRHAAEGNVDVDGAQDRTGRRGGGDRRHAYAASGFGWRADCSRRLRAARLSTSFPMRLRCTCAVPPPMVNIRASRTMRSIGRSHE